MIKIVNNEFVSNTSVHLPYSFAIGMGFATDLVRTYKGVGNLI